MIIGFCGLAGSGKDTAADFLVGDGFTKVAIADPLKRICRDIFQFTEEQLWGPSPERDKPDLRYWRFSVSKEEIQKRTEEWHSTFSKAPDYNGPTFSETLGLTPEEYRYYVETGGYLTPRLALQLLGTEWGRACYPNVWIDFTLRVTRELLETQLEDDKWLQGPKGFHRTYYSGPRGLYDGLSEREVKGVTLSDVRFINEIEAINAEGGCVYQLLRGQGLSGSAGLHKSETEIQSIPKHLFKGVIDNRNWSLSRLQTHMRTIQQDILKGR